VLLHAHKIGVGQSLLLAMRKIAYPDVFELHIAAAAGVQLQRNLAQEAPDGLSFKFRICIFEIFLT
jgi:hypothetical protein